MVRRVVGFGFVIGLLALFVGGCNTSTPAPVPAGHGSLVTLIQDAPACDILSYQLQVSGLQLRPLGNTTGNYVTAFSTATGLFLSPRFDVESLKDFTTILNLTTVREGTYDRGTLILSATAAATYDPALSPPFSVLPLKQSGVTANINIVPPLVINRGKVSVLKLDYNLAKSVQSDAGGQLTGVVNPVVGATPLTANTTTGYGEMQDMEGFVRTVTPSGAGTQFTGSFLLQTFGQTGASFNVELTDSTMLLGISSLDQLLTASFVEVQGHLDSQGNVVADVIRVEDQEDLRKHKVAFLGPVLTVTRGADGSVRSFTMMVRETEPDDTVQVPLNTSVDVTVAFNTTYQVTFPSMNFASQTFDTSSIAPGENLAVHGTFTIVGGQPVSVTADSIYFRPQTVQGNFASLVTAGSDDRTGAFQFTPCSGVFQQMPIWVVTNNLTKFVNVSGLSALSTVPALLVQGIAFYEPQSTTISGVQVPAGALVILASQVDQP